MHFYYHMHIVTETCWGAYFLGEFLIKSDVKNVLESIFFLYISQRKFIFALTVFFNLPCGEKKNNRKFLKISQRIFIAQCRFFFHNVLQGLKFFQGTFWGCPSACNADFSRVFRLSTPKKGPKNTMMTSKFKISPC